MEVSKEISGKNIQGGDLVRELLSSTGLPTEAVGEELGAILESAGASPQTLTLEELRSAMLAYLDSTLAAVSESPLSEDGSSSLE